MQPTAKPAGSNKWIWVVIGLVVVAIGIFLDPTQVAVGTLAGDAFFEGRPTRYWLNRLSADPLKQSEAETKLQEGGAAAVPVLSGIVGSPTSAEPRLIAAKILTKLGPDAVSAGAVFQKAVNDSDPHLQAVCAAGLPKISVPAETAVPLLTELLKSKHAVVAARALSEYRGAAAATLPVLREMLKDTALATEVRWNAARTIGKIGPEALPAVPDLISAMSDKEATIREHSAEAIGDIGPTAVEGIQPLIQVLTDTDARVRRDAVRSLGYIGPAAKEAVPEIKKLLKDPVARVKDATVAALKAIAPEEGVAAEKQLAAEQAAEAKKPAEKKAEPTNGGE